MIRRREFITLLGGAAAWPLAARAQQIKLDTDGLVRFDHAGVLTEEDRREMIRGASLDHLVGT